MTQFKVYASKNNEDQIIGATVVAYDGVDKVIEKIVVLDEDEVSTLRRLVSELDAKHTRDVSRIDGEITRIDSELDGKSPVGHNHDGRYYSKAYVDDLEDALLSRIGDIVSFDTVVVDVLPSSGVKGVFYFVPRASVESGNVYDEFIWIETERVFEFVGSTEVSVDLSDYYTKGEVDSLIEHVVGGVQGYTVIPDGSDLNNYTEQGLYVTEDMAGSAIRIVEMENSPVDVDFLLEVYKVTDDGGNRTVIQTLHPNIRGMTVNSGNSITLYNYTETWERIYTRDFWGGWYVNYNSYNFHPRDYYKKTETDTLLQAKASTNTASTTANGLMSSVDKGKLDGISTGANKTVVDSSMSSSSTNPVQNKIVYQELSEKADTSHTHNSLNYTVIPAGADLNNYKTPGYYIDNSWYDISSMKNVPIGWSFILEVHQTEGDLVKQIFHAIGSTNLRVLERIYHRSNGWGQWFEHTMTPVGGGE